MQIIFALLRKIEGNYCYRTFPVLILAIKILQKSMNIDLGYNNDIIILHVLPAITKNIRGCHACMVSIYLCNQHLSLLREFKCRSGEVYSIQHYVIKFVSDLQQVFGFLRVLRRSTNSSVTYLQFLLSYEQMRHIRQQYKQQCHIIEAFAVFCRLCHMYSFLKSTKITFTYDFGHLPLIIRETQLRVFHNKSVIIIFCVFIICIHTFLELLGDDLDLIVSYLRQCLFGEWRLMIKYK